MAQPENVRNPLATNKVSVDAFAAGIKAKHPEYKDFDNNALVGAMLEKYPQYADQVEFQASKKKDSTASPSTMAGEPTDLASQPQKETQESLGGALVDSDEPVGFFESVANSGKNIAKNLFLLDDKLNVLTDAAFTAVLGKETADSWFEWSSENLWGENVNESARKSLEEIQSVQESMGETRGILESAKKGDVVGIAAGTVDAVASLATSIIEGSVLFGAPLAIDVVGGSIANYNNEKARTMGIEATELWESDEAEILMPTITGALSFGLERFGQGKLAKQLKGAFLATEVGEQAAKNVGKFGATKLGKAFMSNPNREGMTELTQGMIEEFSLADARGESFDAVDYLTSEEAWEQYVMGAVGAKALELGGKKANRLIYGTTAKTQEKQEKKEKIIAAEQEIQDPETPADEKRELRKTQKELAKEIQEIQAEEAEVLESFTDEDKAELAEIDRELKKKEGVLKRSKKEVTINLHKEAIAKLVERKKAIEAKYESATKQEETTIEQADFVETGEVSDETITGIATKIKESQELTTEEQAIYQEKSAEVESKLQEFAKQETPVETKTPAKKAAKKTADKPVEVSYRKGTYVVAPDGTITNKKTGKEISATSVVGKNVLKQTQAPEATVEAAPAVEPTVEPTAEPKKKQTKKSAPAKSEPKSTKPVDPVKTPAESKPVESATEKKVDQKEIEAQKKVLEAAPRKRYNAIKSPLVKRRRGWLTAVEKVDKRSGSVIRYEAEVFVNTRTGKVTHKVTEYKNGKKIKSQDVKDAKSLIDAVNKRLKQGAVVAENVQREFDQKVTPDAKTESEKAEKDRIVQFEASKKDKTYKQIVKKVSYKNAKGEPVELLIRENKGTKPSGVPYATITYPDGRVVTIGSKQAYLGEEAKIARRTDVKFEDVGTFTKDPSKQEESSRVTDKPILPEVAKKDRIKKPRKRKLPNNTKPYKPIVVRQRTDFEPAVFKVYTPDGDVVYFEKQITQEYSQVEEVSKGRYSAKKGAKGYDSLRQAVAGLREEYNAENKVETKETPKKEEPKKETPKKAAKPTEQKKDANAESIKIEEDAIADAQLRIENLLEEIEIERSNIKEAKAESNKEIAALGKAKISKTRKEERVQEIKDALQDTIDQMKDQISIYKEDITGLKSEINKSKRKLTKLGSTKSTAKKAAPKKKVEAKNPEVKVDPTEDIVIKLDENNNLRFYVHRGMYFKADTRRSTNPADQITDYPTKEKWEAAIQRAKKKYGKTEVESEQPVESKSTDSNKPFEGDRSKAGYRDAYVPRTKEEVSKMSYAQLLDAENGYVSKFSEGEFLSSLISEYIGSIITGTKRLNWYRKYVDDSFRQSVFKNEGDTGKRWMPIAERLDYLLMDGNAFGGDAYGKDLERLKEGFKKFDLDLDEVARDWYVKNRINKERKQLQPRVVIRMKSDDANVMNSSGISYAKVKETIRKANSLIKIFAPDVTIITHKNAAFYADAMKENARTAAEQGESARFIYNINTGNREIHINTDLATATTAVHEVFHAFYNTMFNSDPELANKMAKSLYRSLISGSKEDKQVAGRLLRFIKRYESVGGYERISGEVRGEEFMAELAGIMSDNQNILKPSTLSKIVNAIKEFILKTADKLGFKGNLVEALREDIKSDINNMEAVEFIRGFVNATEESFLAPEQNRINDVFTPSERKQLTPEEEQRFADLTEEKQEKRNKLKTSKDVLSFMKGLFPKFSENMTKEGMFYSETQKKITTFLEAMNSQLSRTAFRVRLQGRQLRKLTSTPEQLATVEEYLIATPEAKVALRDEISKFSKGEEILAVADGMREFIDDMSKKFLESPYFDSLEEIGFKKVESYISKKKKTEGKTMYRIVNTRTGEVMESELSKTVAYERLKDKGLRDIIRENLGTYLHTSYKFFKDKDFKITDKSKNKAIEGAYEAIKLARLEKMIAEGVPEKDAIEALRDKKVVDSMIKEAKKGIDEYVREIEALRKDSEFKFSGLSTSAVKIPKPAFQKKKGLPDYIETLLGKENDPVNRFTDTAVVMMRTYYKAQLISKISETLGTDYIKESITDEEKASGNWKKVDDQYSPINGKFVQADVFEMLNSKPLLQSDQAIINYYFKGLKLMRKSKVVWNIPTWRKNWTGGWFFMAANGIVNKNMAKDTLNRAERLFKGQTNEDIEALLDEMAEYGLIGTDVNAGLIDLNDAALGMMFTEEPLGKYEGKLKKLHAKLKNADSRIAEKYAQVDDYTKLVIYRVEKESFAKKLYGKNYSELTESQQSKVREEAAEFVKQNTPTFSRLPKWYTKGRFKGKEISLAQAPLGDFLGFKLESVRSMASNLKNAKEDLEKASDKSLSDVQRAEYRKAGMRRMTGALSVLSMRAIIPTIAASIALDDEDEEIAEDAVKLRPSWMEGHSLLVKSISDEGIVKVYNYSMEDPYAELTAFDSSFFTDFLQPNMMVKLAVHLAEGQNAYGQDIYEKADPAVIKLAKALRYTTKQMVVPPSLVALAKYKDPSQMVIRDYEINIGQQFYFQAKEYVSKEKYTDLTGNARKNRLSALDDVRDMYQSVMKIAFAKGNMKMAKDANRILNRFGKVEKAYIISGIELK